MITITLHCPYCGSDGLVRNGRAPNGKQNYLCRTCQKQSRENPTPHAYPEERREEILRTYEERSSLRGRQPHLWCLTSYRDRLDKKKPARGPR